MRISWEDRAWDDYLYWQRYDKQMINKINQLIKDICRNPYDSLGKSEALKGNLSSYWSRRISQGHRLIYKIENDVLVIYGCRGHYDF